MEQIATEILKFSHHHSTVHIDMHQGARVVDCKPAKHDNGSKVHQVPTFNFNFVVPAAIIWTNLSLAHCNALC